MDFFSNFYQSYYYNHKRFNKQHNKYTNFLNKAFLDLKKEKYRQSNSAFFKALKTLNKLSKNKPNYILNYYKDQIIDKDQIIEIYYNIGRNYFRIAKKEYSKVARNLYLQDVAVDRMSYSKCIKNFQNSIEYYEKMLKSDPENKFIKLKIAKNYYYMGWTDFLSTLESNKIYRKKMNRLRQSMANFKRASELDSENKSITKDMATLYYYMAITSCIKAERARIYYEDFTKYTDIKAMKYFYKAIDNLKEALKLDPKNLKFSNELKELYSKYNEEFHLQEHFEYFESSNEMTIHQEQERKPIYPYLYRSSYIDELLAKDKKTKSSKEEFKKYIL